MTVNYQGYSLSAREQHALNQAVVASPFLPQRPPSFFSDGSKRSPGAGFWPEVRPVQPPTQQIFSWSETKWGDGPVVFFMHNRVLLAEELGGRLDVSELLGRLRALPFELFVAGSRFDQWPGDEYRPPGFADGHAVHGWACAFRGDGHDRLVSRRWLEHGPWRLIRDQANDISFVQFHDLAADAETALEQARPGHERMGISQTGGFIQTDFNWIYDWKGFYLDEEQVLEIVVTGRVDNDNYTSRQRQLHLPTAER